MNILPYPDLPEGAPASSPLEFAGVRLLNAEGCPMQGGGDPNL